MIAAASPSPATLALRAASRQVVRELGFLQDHYAPADVTHSQCHALIELGHRGVLTAGELAATLRLDKSTTSRTVAQLLERGWAEARVDPADRRRKPLALTPAGRERLDRIHDSASAQVEEALGLLSGAQRDTVVDGMRLYAAALERRRRQQGFTIRPITAADDPDVARVIRQVMPEFGASGPGFALHDPEVDGMFAAYDGSGDRAAYFVLSDPDGRVVGGAGVVQLEGDAPYVCELRKMYLLPESRGLGLGRRLLLTALDAARSLGYRTCYLETLEHMSAARRLYERHGFQRLLAPRGATGHFGCDAWYAREL